ncbi:MULTISPECIES: hypothetical protein [Mycobacteriaceae]|jgi:hypothetical protein|uniref:Uncharacterized protein n=1 Tax=Mycolicibacterium senegalense TaxID=1796 RepID=A0ABR5FMH5_9MYCO|nr:MULTISPECIES: hypothetical protein [Mycolicibacterium]KLI09338.1 hypothetical protein AA982_04650 [Mycolicibacterium senegalense]KLO47730.1 hypothetical protein ABW05_31670 [Mycolicibacterium senegalense]OMB84107.1 hypothetical protein A5741_21025 [Mycolicibacterium conceptionense]
MSEDGADDVTIGDKFGDAWQKLDTVAKALASVATETETAATTVASKSSGSLAAGAVPSASAPLSPFVSALTSTLTKESAPAKSSAAALGTAVTGLQTWAKTTHNIDVTAAAAVPGASGSEPTPKAGTADSPAAGTPNSAPLLPVTPPPAPPGTVPAAPGSSIFAGPYGGAAAPAAPPK